jgi:hypothetical protein
MEGYYCNLPATQYLDKQTKMFSHLSLASNVAIDFIQFPNRSLFLVTAVEEGGKTLAIGVWYAL